VLLLIVLFVVLTAFFYMERTYDWFPLTHEERRIYIYPIRYLLLLVGGFMIIRTPIAQFERFRLADYLIYPLIIVGVAILAAILNVNIDRHVSDSWLVKDTNPLPKVNHLILAVFLAPVVEELFFRGILFKTLLNVFQRKEWIAIVLAGILFGLTHFNPSSMLTNSLTGITYCFIYWRTKNFTVTMFCHMVQNGLFHLINY